MDRECSNATDCHCSGSPTSWMLCIILVIQNTQVQPYTNTYCFRGCTDRLNCANHTQSVQMLLMCSCCYSVLLLTWVHRLIPCERSAFVTCNTITYMHVQCNVYCFILPVPIHVYYHSVHILFIILCPVCCKCCS